MTHLFSYICYACVIIAIVFVSNYPYWEFTGEFELNMVTVYSFILQLSFLLDLNVYKLLLEQKEYVAQLFQKMSFFLSFFPIWLYSSIRNFELHSFVSWQWYISLRCLYILTELSYQHLSLHWKGIIFKGVVGMKEWLFV